jgi:diaminopimelate decarboxylase
VTVARVTSAAPPPYHARVDDAADPAPAPDPRRDAAVQQALAELGCADADELHVGGIAVRELAARFGTPFYAFDLDRLRARALLVQQALGPRIRLLWSVKANPSLAVTAALHAAGAGAEVASLGEFEVALAAGHEASDLRFSGPGKTDAELAAAVARGLGCVHAESADEVDAIAAAAAGGRRQGVAVRVNLPQGGAGARLRMSGDSSRFGVDLDQVPALLRRIAGEKHLELRGLHGYAGTQAFDANAVVAHARALAAHRDRLERELRLPLPELDLGGGFGSAHYLGDPAFDLAAAGRGLREVVAAHDRPDLNWPDLHWPERRWFVELGRFLAAPIGVYVAAVVRTKTSGGRRHLILDGGLHHCGVAAGVGTVLRRPPLLVPAAALRAPAVAAFAIGGPLCTPQDHFAGELRLPALGRGDLLAVLGAGAYGLTYSSTMFLSHPAPAEVAVERGAARVVRRRGAAADALRGQQP